MSAAGLPAAGTIEVFAFNDAAGGAGVGVDGNAPPDSATRVDAPGLDFLDVFGLSMFEPTREKALARVGSYAADPSVTILVHRIHDGRAPDVLTRRDAGRIDGCIAYRRDGDSLEVVNIGTAPAVRGAGLGRRLIEAAIEREKPQAVRLETDNDAVGFYRRCGFSVTSLGEKYPGIERFECRLCRQTQGAGAADANGKAPSARPADSPSRNMNTCCRDVV